MSGQKNFHHEKRIRSFIALHPDDHARKKIAEVQASFRALPAQVKWEREDKLHITLKFIGDTTEDVLEKMDIALRSRLGSLARFHSTLDLIGCFPNLHSPRIVWIGFSQAHDSLFSLGNASEEAAFVCGFDREKKAFHPHITIGRVKGSDRIIDLQNAVKSITFDSIDVHFTAVSIMKSVLQPSGSAYTELSKILLAGGS